VRALGEALFLQKELEDRMSEIESRQGVKYRNESVLNHGDRKRESLPDVER